MMSTVKTLCYAFIVSSFVLAMYAVGNYFAMWRHGETSDGSFHFAVTTTLIFLVSFSLPLLVLFTGQYFGAIIRKFFKLLYSVLVVVLFLAASFSLFNYVMIVVQGERDTSAGMWAVSLVVLFLITLGVKPLFAFVFGQSGRTQGVIKVTYDCPTGDSDDSKNRTAINLGVQSESTSKP